jgi:FkbM family methyltransferase
MNSIAFFPVVTEEDQFIDLISRAAWFLAHSAADRIVVPVLHASLKDTAWRVAPGMDPAIAAHFDALRSKLSLVHTPTADTLQAVLAQATVVLRWQQDGRPPFASAPLVAQWLAGKKLLQVDPVAIRQEGSFYIEAGLHLLKNREALVEENRRKFEQLAQRIGHHERAYVLATGPSVADYPRFDYRGALGIVCNSVILDEALMSTVRPKILAFADPIFHFGPSQYAGAFREKLRESVQRHDLTICIPFKYYALFVAAMPDLRERTVAVPFAKRDGFNFDLGAEFTVKTTANILTFLLLPLAANFADEVHILGCDGRPLAENNYFWGHNASTQINDKMANIRAVHPGFFAIDYNDYYLEHCQTLETLCQEGEAQGKRLVSIGFSHIPALNSRSGRGARRGAAGPGTEDASGGDVVIIDPDANNWSGHYMAYNDKLSAALQRAGCTVRVLCHRKIDPTILAQRPNFVPLLDTHSWSVGQSRAPEHSIKVWGDEIAAAVRRLPMPAPTTTFYLYTGSLEHAQGLAALTQRSASIHVHVNLFYLSLRDLKDPAWIERWRPFMQWLDQSGPRFVATVPTREVQTELLMAFGVILDMAPHPSTGVDDGSLGQPRPERPPAQALQVLFPGALRLEKGFLDTLDCVRLLGGEDRIRTRLRHAPTASTPNELRELPADLPDNAEVVAGTLDNDAFDRFLAGGDLIVLPYTADAFAKRTSGLLIDALHHGLPAVVVEGTWLATLVRRHGCGVVVPDAMPASLRDGVLEVAARIDELRARVREAAVHYFARNNWRELAAFVLRPFRPGPERPRLLCIDLTSLDGVTATGRVKEAFFAGWPAARFRLASLHSASGQMQLTGIDGGNIFGPAADEPLIAEIRAFAPSLIYYRAVDHDTVHAFAKAAIDALAVPYVIHMMDDWPERLRGSKPDHFARYDADLRRWFAGARACLSISAAMSSAFAERYGVGFQAFANAVDPAMFPPRRVRPGGPTTLRIVYTGALAEDMNARSVEEVAAALPGLPGVTLDIYTREPWLTRAQKTFEGNPSVSVRRQVAAADYPALLQLADALLIAYNFDDASQRYVGLSMANKLPEYLASGTPVIAYGPASIATIAELQSMGCAAMVTAGDPRALASALDALCQSAGQRELLGSSARLLAFERFNQWQLNRSFLEALVGASQTPSAPAAVARALIGPFGRDKAVHWDETEAVARLFSTTLQGSVLIDVGAHHGSASMPFLRRGWTVLAFEPDETNRAVLQDNLAAMALPDLAQRFTLETRAVSDRKQQGMAFYRSAQSTGISGLSAFHESHEQRQTVDTVTLAEVMATQGITSVDFLKIDTEGHDLMVLKGFPWDRCKPRVVECEFEDAKTVALGYRFDDLAGFLVERGYTVYVSEWHPIVRYGVRHDWRRLSRYPCSLMDERSWGNLIAFRDPVDERHIVNAVQALVPQLARVAATPAVGAVSRPRTPVGPVRFRGASPGTQREPTGHHVWRPSAADVARGQALFCHLVFDADGTAGREMVGLLQLVANRDIVLHVALCRHGLTPYEGARRPVSLRAGVAQTLRLRHRFAGQHAGIRLQLEVAASDAEALEVSLPSAWILETAASVASRIPAPEQTLRTANRLFRDGDLGTALGLYLDIGSRIPLRMYRDNAENCVRRMGLPTADGTDALLKMLS